jgi:hypothetical protein
LARERLRERTAVGSKTLAASAGHYSASFIMAQHQGRRGVAQLGSAPALGARSSLLKALLILTASNESNNLGHLLFAQVKLQRPNSGSFDTVLTQTLPCRPGGRRPAAFLADLGERVRVSRVKVVGSLLGGVGQKADGVKSNG